MFKNYFKLAIKVLGRHRFFTFISLFGISFTLMILMLVTAFLDTELGSHAPLSERDNMVFLSRVTLKKMRTDTIITIDTTMQGGVEVYDSTYKYNENSSSTSSANAGFTFLKDYFTEIEGAKAYTFFSPGAIFDIFNNGNKLTFSGLYADANIWNIFDFPFTEGKPFDANQTENQALSIVISQKAAQEYFGKKTGLVGETMKIESKNYTVVGVVKSMRGPQGLDPDVIIPYTNMPASSLENENKLQGGFEAIFLAKNEKDRTIIQSEILKKAALIPLPHPEDFNKLILNPLTFRESYAQKLYYDEDAANSLNMVYTVLSTLLLLFVLLPTLNLINLNISRIMERSSEIGVRKAFGASSGNILIQFVFENVILTFIGGIIGFTLALLLINTINSSQVLGNVTLQFNTSVFVYSLVICFLFGILSGIIPAYRMSKIHIVDALKR